MLSLLGVDAFGFLKTPVLMLSLGLLVGCLFVALQIILQLLGAILKLVFFVAAEPGNTGLKLLNAMIGLGIGDLTDL